MQVQCGTSISDPFNAANGLGQGAVLSANLCAICLDELLAPCGHSQSEMHCRKYDLNQLLFADKCLFPVSVITNTF